MCSVLVVVQAANSFGFVILFLDLVIMGCMLVVGCVLAVGSGWLALFAGLAEGVGVLVSAGVRGDGRKVGQVVVPVELGSTSGIGQEEMQEYLSTDATLDVGWLALFAGLAEGVGVLVSAGVRGDGRKVGQVVVPVELGSTSGIGQEEMQEYLSTDATLDVGRWR
ncbi:hypothetical protein GOBAR_DD06506 [Gossypium barbadense]|nr:hypothetical protein GOBAR_DD06506 [Gossypium barbadense]